MLLTLTPNPALDRLVIAPGFRSSTITRVAEVREAAGGKGLNVARAAQALGAAVRTIAPLGGSTGRYVAELAAREGLDAQWAWITAGETRTCTLVTDPEARDTLALNERGPHVSPADWSAFAAFARAQAAQAALVTCSGSLPPHVSPEAFAALLADIAANGTPVMLDTSGAALATALSLPLALIKANQHEIAEALGVALASVEDAATTARHLTTHGPAQVMITLGAAGAILATHDRVWHARPPTVQIVTDVGSGDSALAAFAVATLNGEAPEAALGLAVACGTANALLPGPAVFNLADVAMLLRTVVIEQLS